MSLFIVFVPLCRGYSHAIYIVFSYLTIVVPSIFIFC